ncbi:dicarboxylate/amino acid:cation symporter [Rarobacter incanus]|uniref:L-cystine uptake protein TcyP n=1 Tax=Rarobacter incanus TaxID=153494 RepID=A0A542SPG1_9MICO|nr:dicarboxylate/amino acid:cation symporter [Rarobacter incanus]TQK76511.1 hypothetical protein FB389_1187 [Rarobacter incanus]
MNIWDVAALAVTIGLAAGIFSLHRRKVNFSVLTFIALFVGIAVGIVFRGHTDYIQPIGRVYVNLLLTIVAPLIIVSILSSIVSLGSISQLKTIGGRSLGWLLWLNLIAIFLSLGVALQMGLGKGADLATAGIDTRSLDTIRKPFSEVFIGFFPTNVVNDIANDNIIPIIVFTILIAVAYALVAERAPRKVEPFKRLVEALREIIYRAVGFIIALTPYAVLALTSSFASSVSGNASQLWALFALLAATFIVCFTDAFIVNAVVLKVSARLSPVAFFRKIAPAQLAAFTTQSSAGTLPLTTTLLRNRVGVPAEIAGFTAPLGTTIGMPGCAGVWPILLAVYAVNGLGIPYGFGDYALLVVLGLVVSVGTAGVPGTATVTATTVMAAAGLPIEVVILTLPISAVADMARTMTNVTAAAVAATVVARKEHKLDDTVFASESSAFDLVVEDVADTERSSAPIDSNTDEAPAFPYGGVPIGACGLDSKPARRERVPVA